MPPHHMGMWDKKSLKYLTKIFKLTIESIRFEPLQTYHIDWYYGIISQKFLHPNLISILNKSRLNTIIKFIIKNYLKVKTNRQHAKN